MRTNRFALALAPAVLACTVLAGLACAQTTADPVIAKVNGAEIRVSDVTEAAQGLPAEYRGMPQNVLIPMLTDQLIDRAAIVVMARKAGLDKDPATARAIARAVDETLENAQMRKEIEPTLTDAAVLGRYNKDVAGKEGEPEVHARHILLASEADAVKVIADLKKGGDFAAIAKERSSDPGAGQGGDLGFFKKGDMVPEFSAVAFTLKAGEISEKPVKSQFGWHVIKVEERRAAPPPAFEQAQEQIRQSMIQEGVSKLLATARAGVTIERCNPDGTPRKMTDDVMPPGHPKP